MPSRHSEEDSGSDSLLTHLSQRFGGDDGDEGEEATQAMQASKCKRRRAQGTPRPSATVTSAAAEHTDEAEEKGEEANQVSQPPTKKVKLTPRPSATVTSGAAEHTDETEEDWPPPLPKKSSVFESLTPAQEERLVDFFASPPFLQPDAAKL